MIYIRDLFRNNIKKSIFFKFSFFNTVNYMYSMEDNGNKEIELKNLKFNNDINEYIINNSVNRDDNNEYIIGNSLNSFINKYQKSKDDDKKFLSRKRKISKIDNIDSENIENKDSENTENKDSEDIENKDSEDIKNKDSEDIKNNNIYDHISNFIKKNLKNYFDKNNGILKIYDLNNEKNKKVTYCGIKDNTLRDYEVKKIINDINEEDRVFIQSDTEGKVFNIFQVLKLANIINIEKPIQVYYNLKTGKFEKNLEDENIPNIKLDLYEVNKDFKGTYIHLGDIVDRCNGNYQCLKSLLLLLYIKQELGDKIKLICGNHEFNDYSKNDPTSRCCENIKNLLIYIVFLAIKNDQMKFFDEITIDKQKYTLTHKILYKDDFSYMKNFIKCFSFDKELDEISDLLNPIITLIEEDKEDQEIKIKINKLKEKYKNEQNSNINEEVIKKNINEEDIKKVINEEVIKEDLNSILKLYIEIFFNYISLYIDNTYKKLFFDDIYKYSRKFDFLHNGFINPQRINEVPKENYKNFQICGHDHINPIDSYDKENNIIFTDNFSFVTTVDKGKIDSSNLHLIDKKKGNRNYIGILNL